MQIRTQVWVQSLMLLSDIETTCLKCSKNAVLICLFKCVQIKGSTEWENIQVSITHLTDSLLASIKYKLLQVFGHSPNWWSNWDLTWRLVLQEKSGNHHQRPLKVSPRDIMMFQSKPRLKRICWWHDSKSQEMPSVIRIHQVRPMSVCSKFHDSSVNTF